jgi:integrase
MIIRERIKGGRRYYQVDLGKIDGKRVRKNFKVKSVAKDFLEAKKTEREQHGVQALSLPHADRVSLNAARAKLAKHGVTLTQVVDDFLSRQPTKTVALAAALSECIQAKRAAGRRDRYIAGLESYLQAFIKGRESKHVHEITPSDIETWFVSRGECNGTKASNLGRLSALFGLCVRRGYCPANPCDAIERVKLERNSPEILSVEDCRRLLDVCLAQRPNFLAYIVLGLFAGVRPEECEKLDWSAVDLEQGRVVIDASTSKVRRRRITELSDNAVAWLRLAPNKTGLVVPWKTDRRKRIVRQLRNATAEREFHGPKGWTVLRESVPWCQDILRHTAASHLMARDKDAARVADQLGNSPRVLLTNYRALVTPEETAKFWALRPSA